jgi:hypothetical protein
MLGEVGQELLGKEVLPTLSEGYGKARPCYMQGLFV